MAPKVFARQLGGKVWSTLDLDDDLELDANHKEASLALALPTNALAKRAGVDPRVGARGLLQKAAAEALSTAGEATSEAETLAEWIEASIHAAQCSPSAEGEDALSVAGVRRRYLAEVRRMGAVLREATSSSWLQELRARGAEAAAELVALPPEELLPAAKRARLTELRRMPPQESGEASQQFPDLDERLECVDCGKSGAIRYRRLASTKDGFAKAETWGSRESEEKGERCQAHCPDCFAEWYFEL
eukprot:TRINITY_DN62494_c0_g1_i1.p1 TRINITY_DN62494_c0_g1~~TRINITY_DN62494_c0_g1_i1.p1  ORF type:complete len:246 (+),score=65.10 TRINITY_DN62494_c0_g1_i1:68-805(+)